MIIIFLFLICSSLALYWYHPFSSIFYVFLLVLAFLPLLPFKIDKYLAKMSLTLFLLGSFIYAFLAKYINQIELWGDEIGVIKIANLSFQEIVKYSSRFHTAVPPLDYWNLWLYQNFLKFFSINPDFIEIIYRIPDMAIHLITAILFTLIFINKKRTSLRVFLLIVIFLTYFFNPLLFFYSIEARFYTLSVLGGLVVLILFLKNKLFEVKYLPLLLFFCLNSVFQFIILTPFIIYGLLQKAKKNSFWLFLSSLFLLFLLIYPKLFYPQPIEKLISFQLILIALKQFFVIQFWPVWVLFSMVLFLVICFLINKQKSKLIFISFCLIFYLITISFLAYMKGYFDFYLRHFLFVLPFLLYLLFSSARFLSKKYIKWFLVFLLFGFTLPWSTQSIRRLTHQDVFSKALIGSRTILQTAQEKNWQIIIVPNSEESLTNEIYYFYKQSFIWYSQFYPLVKISFFEDHQESCQEFKKNQESVIFSFSGVINCPSDINFKTQQFYGSLIGLHHED